MSVHIDTTGARRLVEVLAATAPSETAVERALDANETFLSFYGTMGVDRDLVREMVRRPNEERANDRLDRLRAGFAEAAADPEAVHARLDEVAALDAETVADAVLEHLPSGTSLDTTVYATVDGFNGGFQFEGDVGVSVVGPVADEAATVLPHELHHAGLFDRLQGTPLWTEGVEGDGPAADVVELLVHLVAEGLAIRYAQGGLDSFSDEAVTAAVDTFREQGDEVVADVVGALGTALKADDQRRREALAEVHRGETALMTPLHFAGARMTATADRVHDAETVVESATDPGRFLRLYQTAAAETDARRLDDDLVADLTAAVP